jgi:hypothetical protein
MAEDKMSAIANIHEMLRFQLDSISIRIRM